MKVKNFYDEPTNTLTYLVYDEQAKDAVVIYPDTGGRRWLLLLVEKVYDAQRN